MVDLPANVLNPAVSKVDREWLDPSPESYKIR